jgi:hypothetical protein
MLRCTVASQFIGNNRRWRLRRTSPKLAEILFGCLFIVPTFHGNIQNISLLLRDLPAIGAFAVDGKPHLSGCHWSPILGYRRRH